MKKSNDRPNNLQRALAGSPKGASLLNKNIAQRRIVCQAKIENFRMEVMEERKIGLRELREEVGKSRRDVKIWHRTNSATCLLVRREDCSDRQARRRSERGQETEKREASDGRVNRS